MDRAEGEVNFRFVRQSRLRNLEFLQRRIVIVIPPIIRVAAGQVRFWKTWLQLQGSLGKSLRLFPPLRRTVKRVHDPAFQLGIAGHGKSKSWVEFEGPLVQLLTLL